MASLEKSRNSLQTGSGVEPLFMLSCERSPVMLTWFRQLARLVGISAPKLFFCAELSLRLFSAGETRHCHASPLAVTFEAPA